MGVHSINQMASVPLIVGRGEVGEALFEITRGIYPSVQWLDVEPEQVSGKISIMHICYPYTNSFIGEVINHIRYFKPELTIIESTVVPYTTLKIFEETNRPICHSPYRGNVKDGFKWAFFSYTKYIGPVKPEYGKIAEEHYQKLGFKTYLCNSPLETEFMKLIETTYYGLLIGWFQEVHRICRKFNLDEVTVVSFLSSIQQESGGKHLRPTFYPGFIGGHCVVPNAKLLQKIFPSDFIDALLKSNDRRQKELEKAE